MELSERKQKILGAVVEQYIKTGEPVGSKALLNALDFSVSSAYHLLWKSDPDRC